MKHTMMMDILLLACVSVQAQDKTPQHEVAISYGYPTIAFAPRNTVGVCGDFAETWYCNEREFGPMSLEYYYRLSPLLGVGGFFTLINIKQDIEEKDGKVIGDYTERYYSIMPSIKVSWLRGEYIALYSKAALGICLNPETTKGADSQGVKVDRTEHHVGPMYHLTLLGLEVGGRLRVFGEFGFGVKGVYSLGLRYQF